MYRFCGKTWTNEDIERIRTIISSSPQANRLTLSKMVCESFSWISPNGKLKEMSCRVAMLKMYRGGLINLPPPRTSPRPSNGIFTSEKSDPEPDLYITLKDLKDLRIDLVPKGPKLRLWNEYISRYHYLGYKMLPGAQLRYFIIDGDRILGAMGFGAAAWKVAYRDRFIGWTSQEREQNLHFIINQSRFLILPWIHCKNLATKSLSLVNSRLSDDWQYHYGYRPVLVESFVDTTRFTGHCYKAGNWINVGLTQGRTRNDRYNNIQAPIKSIWLMPLKKNFKVVLCGGKR
jgi:hypothetical protein